MQQSPQDMQQISIFEEDLSTKDLFASVGIITTLEGTEATYDTINGTDIFANGLRATKLATPNAAINTGIVTTLIVPYETQTLELKDGQELVLRILV